MQRRRWPATQLPPATLPHHHHCLFVRKRCLSSPFSSFAPKKRRWWRMQVEAHLQHVQEAGAGWCSVWRGEAEIV